MSHDHEPPTPQDIPLDAIIVGAQLIRSCAEDDDLIELANDIASHGLMQPIGVRAAGNGTFQLLFGHRRLLAHRRLNRPTIRASVFPASVEPIKTTALRENLHRRPMTLEEEISVVAHLHHEENRSPDTIAVLVSKTRSWVLRRLAAGNLPENIRTPLLDGTLPLGHAEEIAKITDQAARDYVLSQCLVTKPPLSALRQLCETIAAAPNIAEAVAAGVEVSRHPENHPTILIACDACRTGHEPHRLTLVRLCPDCAAPATSTPDDARANAH